MTSADDLPALPSLHGTAIDDGEWYSAGQMRAYALAARAERDLLVRDLQVSIEELGRRVEQEERFKYAANERAEAAEARVKELSEKENAADMCLQSVHEARKIIKEHLGGNCAFLDDDLVRWVVRGLDEIKEERDALRARLEEIRKQPTVSHTAEPYPRELIHRPDLST